jgi:hypothetical protein
VGRSGILEADRWNERWSERGISPRKPGNSFGCTQKRFPAR